LSKSEKEVYAMKDSKKILETLTSKEEIGSKKKRENRLLDLLANFHNGYAEGWYMCVP
jgi:hypothetical protein